MAAEAKRTVLVNIPSHKPIHPALEATAARRIRNQTRPTAVNNINNSQTSRMAASHLRMEAHNRHHLVLARRTHHTVERNQGNHMVADRRAKDSRLSTNTGSSNTDKISTRHLLQVVRQANMAKHLEGKTSTQVLQAKAGASIPGHLPRVRGPTSIRHHRPRLSNTASTVLRRQGSSRTARLKGKDMVRALKATKGSKDMVSSSSSSSTVTMVSREVSTAATRHPTEGRRLVRIGGD